MIPFTFLSDKHQLWAERDEEGPKLSTRPRGTPVLNVSLELQLMVSIFTGMRLQSHRKAEERVIDIRLPESLRSLQCQTGVHLLEGDSGQYTLGMASRAPEHP